PRDELQLVEIIGAAETDLLLAIGCDFQAVHGEIEVATLEPAEDAAELILPELDGSADFSGQSGRNVDLEADVLLGILRILVDVGRAPLGIEGTNEWPARFLV